LNVAVRVSIEKELLRDALWQEVKERTRSYREVADDIVADISFKFFGNEIIDLVNQHGHLRNKLDQTLRHENNSVILAKLGSLADDVGHMLGDLREGLILRFDLLTNKNAVDASPQSALKSDMRGRSTHESDEVVVLLGGNDVRA